MVQSHGILVILMMISLASCQTSDDVKALLTDLFKTKSYNKNVRPVYHQGDVVTVVVDLFLAGDIFVNEVTGKMTSSAYLGLSWYDEHLMWSKDDYYGIKTVYIPQDDIWKPDIILQNDFNKLKAFGDTSILASVYDTGEVVWVPFEIFQTICSIDVTNFPFDIQTCTVELAMFATRVDEITLEIGSEGINRDAYEDSGEWHLLSSSIKLEISGPHGATVIYSFTLRRRPEHYVYNIIIPLIFFSVLAIFTFVIPNASGEKTGFCMSVYLAFAVFLTLIGDILPITPTQSVLNVYLLFLLAVGTIIVIVMVIQLRISHWDSDTRKISSSLKGLVRLSRRMQCHNKVSSSQTEQQLDKVIDEKKIEALPEEITWPDVASSVDFFCFWLLLLTDVVVTCSIFLPPYLRSRDQAA